MAFVYCVWISEHTANFALCIIKSVVFLYPKWRVFTARYALSSYIKQIRFLFKRLIALSSTEYGYRTLKEVKENQTVGGIKVVQILLN